MVTGVQPIQGANEYAIMHAHLTEEPKAPSAIVGSVPAELSATILKAMAKAPEQRFQSAAEFRDALRLPGETTPERVPIPAAALDPQEVRRVESCLMKAVGPIARHLVSQASRRAVSIDELCRLLADQVPDAAEREKFLRSCSRTVSAAAGSSAARSSPSAFGQDLLDEVRRKLTPFLGPVAKVLVDRASRKARTPEDLYSLLAAEIPSDRDRASFLASVPKPG
jgi:serine/threonine-protein kinase